jgi:hypothetical protein
MRGARYGCFDFGTSGIAFEKRDSLQDDFHTSRASPESKVAKASSLYRTTSQLRFLSPGDPESSSSNQNANNRRRRSIQAGSLCYFALSRIEVGTRRRLQDDFNTR